MTSGPGGISLMLPLFSKIYGLLNPNVKVHSNNAKGNFNEDVTEIPPINVLFNLSLTGVSKVGRA